MLTISTASAGAGKTFLLTQTYIDMLFSAHQAKNAHRRILAVTFTKKATAEMKKRIVEELSKLARAEESDFAAGLQEKYTLTDNDLQKHAQEILYDLLQDYGAFAVSTIDSFFQQVIRAFSRELGLSGKYNLELDTKAIQQTAVDDFFFALSSEHDKATFDALLAMVEENLQQDQKWDPKNDILALSAELFKEALILNKDTLFEYLKNTSSIEAYKQQLYAIRQAYYQTYEAARQPVKAYLEENALDYSMFSYGKKVFAPLDYKQSEILAKLPLKDQPNSFIAFAEGEATILKKVDKENVALQMHEEALRRLVQPLYACFRGTPACTCLTAHVILKKFSILTLLGKVSECIDDKNKELNRLAISDTNALLNDVVQANESSPFIYEKIGTRVRHFLIDEFQDTSAMQWTSFRPLIEESLATQQDNLVVGDVKQSIYRFRNSDYSLMLHGIRNDFPLSAQNPLGGNWRSTRSVVNFNNALFGKLSEMLNAEMNEQLTSQYVAYQDVIQEVYHKHEQDPMLAITAAKKQKKVEEGFVQVRFTPCDKKELWREEVLQQLPSLLADIKTRGISLGRVACLVRNNKDALSIADTLIGAGYKVMSNEGLKLKASPAVMLVITYLKSLLNPSDMIQQYALCYFAEQLGIDTTIMERLKAQSAVYSTHNLFDHIQTVIQTLKLLESDHKPYLLALQDLVYDYQNKYTADLYSFVTWWDEHADTKALSMQQTDDAIQLVSIHKSKGLEYDVVIIPFCDWAKAADINSYKNILWVKPLNASGDTTIPPLLPVLYSPTLAQTAFAADYYKELLDLYLDNLNLTYVAFTRAKKELYVFAPEMSESKSKKKGKEKTPSNIGELLHVLFHNNPLAMQQDSNGYATTFRMGVQDTYTHKKQQKETDEKEQWKLSLPLLPDIPMKKPKFEATTADKQDKGDEDASQEQRRFAIRFSSQDFFGDEENGAAFGSLMHQILQQVYVRGDEDKVIAEMLRMGMLQQSELPAVRASMQQFWTLIAKKGKGEWYDPNRYTILNEQEILLRTGTIKRADRILVDKATKQAIVIDYKFGEERKKYYQQVREYMSYLRDMGYSVEGYLCYVTQEEIKDVKAF